MRLKYQWYAECMDVMEWQDVKDPSGQVEFIGNWYIDLANSYLPEDIQDLIDKNDVLGMVQEVNKHFRSAHRQASLFLANRGGQKILTHTYVPKSK